MSLLYLVTFLLIGVVQADYFTATGLTPKYVPTSPTSNLTFKYGSTTVQTGGRYSFLTTLVAPQVQYPANPNKNYTLVFLNLDATVDRTVCNLTEDVVTEYLLWQVVNIPGGNVGAGVTVTPYAFPLNELGTVGGTVTPLDNRCVAVVAQQTKQIEPESLDAVVRDCFNFKEFAAKYGLRLDNYAGLAFNSTGQLLNR